MKGGRGNKRMRRVCRKKRTFHSLQDAYDSSFALNRRGFMLKPYACGNHWHLCKRSKEERLMIIFDKIENERKNR